MPGFLKTKRESGALTSGKRFAVSAMDQMNHIVRQIGDQQLHCVLKFNGKIDLSTLQRAVEMSLHLEPVLGCRYVERHYRAQWEHHTTLDKNVYCQIIESPEISDALWDFICTPGDPGIDPLVQVRLFRSQGDTLCIKINHVAADATGCKQYLYLLANLYTHLSQDGSSFPTYKPRTMRSENILFRHVSLRALIRGYQNKFSPTPTWGFPGSSTDFSGLNYSIMRLPPARFRSLREYGHRYHATVNDVVLTAFYRALFAILNPPPDRPLPISVPVDLRRYLAKDYPLSICNFSSSIFPILQRIPDEKFEQTLVRLHDTLDNLKGDYPGVSSTIYQAWCFIRGYEVGKKRIQDMQTLGMQYGTFYPMLTNFGVMDHNVLNFADLSPIDAYMVSPLFYPPGFMVGVNTFRDTFTLIAGFCDTATDQKVILKFMEMLNQELPGEELVTPGITFGKAQTS